MANLEMEMDPLLNLVENLKQCQTTRSRIVVLDEQDRVKSAFSVFPLLAEVCCFLDEEHVLVVKSLIVVGQGEILFELRKQWTFSHWFHLYQPLLDELLIVEKFYRPLGGIVGYHVGLLTLLQQKNRPTQDPGRCYHPPVGIDISFEHEELKRYVWEGIVSLPLLAELYPVGGAADRLRLLDPVNKDPLPAARLVFCGETLLEGLIQDVQAREWLYFKLFGKQVVTPIAMMTSSEKNNHEHIVNLCRESQWFGRGEEQFRFFRQPLVPALDLQGNWCISGPAQLLMKPGGHGVLWKAAQDEGVLDWMEERARTKMLVRQINNPIAGVDYGLFAFCGVGFAHNKQFGFSSCFRQVSSAEGVNVLIEKRRDQHTYYCLTNIEYCDFATYEIPDVPIEPGATYSRFPSNTNILFADIGAVREGIQGCPIPGMLVNTKRVTVIDAQGCSQEKEVIRLESTMQNLADYFEKKGEGEQLSALSLPTFLTHHKRHKTISAIKKMWQQGGGLLETPEGCFYDLLVNRHELLTQHCGLCLPALPSQEDYIDYGPSFLFFYHPALGPLFSLIGQKIRGGSLGYFSELSLAIAEVDIENLTLNGVLQVQAECIMGEKDKSGILHYSDKTGKCILHQVKVENQGIDTNKQNTYWKREIIYKERCEIIIQGSGEFYASGVTLRGSMRIEVKEGTRKIAFEEDGEVKFREELLSAPLQALWNYRLSDELDLLCTRSHEELGIVKK